MHNEAFIDNRRPPRKTKMSIPARLSPNLSVRKLWIAAAICIHCSVLVFADDPAPCPLAHAHNDYLHDRPLLDALANGFCSVEADIFLVDGELLVAHTRFGLRPNRTLRSLYLEPLRERIRVNDGSVYGDGQQFTLLIDIKTDGAETYRVLSELLAEYSEVVTSVEKDEVQQRAVTAIVSGNRATEVIAADTPRYVGIDGRLSDLESDAPSHVLPLISDSWPHHFRWRGVGQLRDSDREKLAQVIKQAHEKKRRVRFWATPDRPEVWKVLRDAGVDLINTDDLEGLSRFLRSSTQSKNGSDILE